MPTQKFRIGTSFQKFSLNSPFAGVPAASRSWSRWRSVAGCG